MCHPIGRLPFSEGIYLLRVWRAIGMIAIAMLLKNIVAILILVFIGSSWTRLEG
jgi:hypothetical protein